LREFIDELIYNLGVDVLIDAEKQGGKQWHTNVQVGLLLQQWKDQTRHTIPKLSQI
jgi:hypothetical protein